ncbi:hypothetical protein GCM10009093_14850 [Brevundimonas terrae]|uniref:Uncharacterized protein n=1 Tax=Brevundimonas terrae TaxID=363631 RepID=A0ABP3I4N4_9CAUL|nr:hypothetical protein [Brevundimonas terrae]NIJ26218.1 hypothetical protein [Brevundimonas terrae]
MFLVTGLMLAVLMLAATPQGRAAGQAWVRDIAQRLNAITSGQVLFYAALALAGLGLVVLFEAEGLRVFAMVAPEAVMWFAAFDMAIMLDAMVLLAGLGAMQKLRTAMNGLRQWQAWIVAVVRRGAIQRRKRPARTSILARRKDRDDPDPRGLVWA